MKLKWTDQSSKKYKLSSTLKRINIIVYCLVEKSQTANMKLADFPGDVEKSFF